MAPSRPPIPIRAQRQDLAEGGNDEERILATTGSLKSPKLNAVCAIDVFGDVVWDCETEILPFRRNPQWRADVFTVSQQMALEGRKERARDMLIREGNNLSIDEEDGLISDDDPSRIPPSVSANTAMYSRNRKGDQRPFAKGKKGIPSLVPVKLGDGEDSNLPKTHPTLIARRKNPELMSATLCVRGDEIHGCAEYDTSAPTSARMSSKAVIFLASVMRWKIGAVDISQAFLQADLIIPSQRVVGIAPWFIPTPWRGRVDLSRDKYAKPTWGWLTMRPLYGTNCAPLRRFQKTVLLLSAKPMVGLYTGSLCI